MNKNAELSSNSQQSFNIIHFNDLVFTQNVFTIFHDLQLPVKQRL